MEKFDSSTKKFTNNEDFLKDLGYAKLEVPVVQETLVRIKKTGTLTPPKHVAARETNLITLTG